MKVIRSNCSNSALMVIVFNVFSFTSFAYNGKFENYFDDAPFLKEIESYTKDVDSVVDKGAMFKNERLEQADDLFRKIESSESLPKCSDIQEKHEIKITDLIAKGNYGSIYSGCTGIDCNIVIKRTNIDKKFELADFIDEQHSFYLLSSEGITPKVEGAYICKDGSDIFGELLLEKMDSSLEKYLRNNKKGITAEQVQEIFNLVQKMHEKNIVHQDLHIGNILVKADDNGIKFYITDFGGSSHYATGNKKETSKNYVGFKGITSGRKVDQIENDYWDLVRSFDASNVNVTVYIKKYDISLGKSGEKAIAVEVDE